ncbi:Hypothetical_protein [Hexamita inflata]|uniref:Hypothetical_protein n=1 Tax=Hexamita inflata TaxID=28002 RepID=A0AA86QTE5_9EUKA|nr:Hypothetical protein HINF_LOCUS46853 [Hexamita inflata]
MERIRKRKAQKFNNNDTKHQKQNKEQIKEEDENDYYDVVIPEFLSSIFELGRYKEALEFAEILKDYFGDNWLQIVLDFSRKYHNKQEMLEIVNFLIQYETNNSKGKPVPNILQYEIKQINIKTDKKQADKAQKQKKMPATKQQEIIITVDPDPKQQKELQLKQKITDIIQSVTLRFFRY